MFLWAKLGMSCVRINSNLLNQPIKCFFDLLGSCFSNRPNWNMQWILECFVILIILLFQQWDATIQSLLLFRQWYCHNSTFFLSLLSPLSSYFDNSIAKITFSLSSLYFLETSLSSLWSHHFSFLSHIFFSQFR